MFRDKPLVGINNEVLVTVTCYQYGTWVISRGPLEISNFSFYKSNFNFKFFQKTGSDVVVIIGYAEVVFLNSALNKVLKYFLIPVWNLSKIESPKTLYLVSQLGPDLKILKYNEENLSFDIVNI
jgi:hypothetical protein